MTALLWQMMRECTGIPAPLRKTIAEVLQPGRSTRK
jgi:hypothetical protein